MDNNVKVNINVTSNGTTDRETKKAKELQLALDQAAKAAGRVGTAGSKAVAAKALPPTDRPTSQTFMAAQVQQYGQQRGAAGMTGASARDFANQAQGLGGLVRLYATYAANVFAVGMAFRALSAAMDTTNMVRGLNQIGAASGVALGALSKELVSATGGAISLREAMSATVKVTAAGLGSENVLRLGNVAAKASQALGVDMTDAIGRLSRGITKLEPELLDELGIFTKIEPAVQKYSLAVGKTASQLTDFERRQAFANAVLEEGEKKFAAIQVDANPYNKLAASFQNLAQTGLELINKILAPIAAFLSSSPTALVSILSLFGVKLLQQVLPALSEFKTGLESAAAKSTEVLKQRVAEAQQIRKKAADIAAKNLNIQLEREIDAVDAAAAKMQALRDKRQFSLVRSAEGKAALATLQDPYLDPTSQRAATAINAAQLEAVRISKLRVKGSADEARAINELATGTQRWAEVTKSQANNQAKLDAETKRLSGSLFSVLGINTKLSESAEKSAIRNNIVQTTAYTASVAGLRTAFSVLSDEIEKENITGVGKAALFARGAFAALTGAVSTLFSALSKLFFYVGIAVAAYEALQLLVSFASKNQKEQKAFGEAIDKSTSRLEAFGRTVDYISKLPFTEQINTANIGAKATSIGELSNSLNELAKSFEEQNRTAGAIDIVTDKLKGLIGFNTKAETFAESFGKTLFAGLKNAGSSRQAEEAKNAISEVLKIDLDTSSEKQFIEAIEKIVENSQKVNKVTGAFKTLSTEFNASASRSKELKSATEELNKAYTTFFNGLKSTDSFDVFGEKLKTGSIKILQSLSDPERALTDLIELINTPSSTQFFSQDAFNQLQKAKISLEALNEEQARNAALINDSKEAYREASVELADLQKKAERQRSAGASAARGLSRPIGPLEVGPPASTIAMSTELAAADRRAAEAARAVAEAQRALDESKANGVKAAREFSLVALSAFQRGANITGAKIEASLSKGASIVTDNLIGALGDLPGAATLRAESEKRQLAVQAALIKATLDQINETRQNTLALEKNNLIRQVDAAIASAGVVPQAEIDKIVVPATAAIEAITKLQTAITGGPRAAQQTIREGIESNRATLILNDRNVTQEQIVSANEQLKIFDQAQEFISRQAALYGQLNELAQKRLSIEDTKIIAGFREQEKVVQDIYARQARGVQTGLEELQTQESLTGYLTEQQRAKQEQLLIDALSIQQSREVSQIFSDINAQQFTLNRLKQEEAKGGDPAGRENRLKAIRAAEDELARRRADLARRGEENESKINQQILKNLQNRQRAEKEVFDFNQDAASKIIEGLTEQQNLRLEVQGLELARLEGIQGFSEIALANIKAQIDSEKLLNQEQQQRFQLQSKQAALLKEQDNLRQQAALGLDTTELERRNQLALEAVNREIELLTLRNSVQLKAIEQTRQQSIEQAKYNELTTMAASITESIKGVFEGLSESSDKFGQGLANVVTLLAEGAINSEKNAKNILEAEKNLAEAKKRELEATEPDDAMAGYSDRIKAEKQLNDANKKATQDELSRNAKLLSSTKSMFKEKTGAYRAISAIEKAMHIASLAMNAQKILSDGMAMASSVSSSLTSAFAAGKKAIAEAFAAPWPIGFAAGAAMAAIISKLLGKSFGGGSGPTGPTAEERQKVQGSAIGYNAQGQMERDAQGNVVPFRRGVLGDAEAKSQLFPNALKLLTDTSVDNLDVNNKMLVALRKIEAGIRGVGAGIAGISGITAGSLFGTKEGSSGFKVLGGLLGSSKTREIIDSGLKFSGSLSQLATSAGELTQIFETVRTTSSKSFLGVKFGSTKESTNIKELDDLATSQARRFAISLTKAFAGAADFTRQTAVAAGFAKSVVNTIFREELPEELRTFSARGLKPDEIGPAYEAWLGSVSDFYAEKIFGNLFDEFAVAGEEISETVARVVRQNEIVNQSLVNTGLKDYSTRLRELPENAGKSAVDITIATAKITDALVIAAGGMEKFAERANFIAQNFLTANQRLAITQQSLMRQLGQMGIPTSEELPYGIGSRADFIAVGDIAAQRLAEATPGTPEFDNIVEFINSWENLAPMFNEVLPKLEIETQNFLDSIEETVTGITREIKRFTDIANYDPNNPFWGLNNTFEDRMQSLRDSNLVTTENVEKIILLTTAERDLLQVQNNRKAQEQLMAFELEAGTKKLKGFAQEVATIAKKAGDLVKALVDSNTATPENIDRITRAARLLYDTAVAENKLRAEQILLGVSATAASLGISQLAREIQGIENTIISAAEQLAELGQLTPEAIQQLLASAEAQIDFARKQNLSQAQDIIKGFETETATQGLSQLAQQIQSVRDRTTAAIRQLAQLGQATQENIDYLTRLGQAQLDFIKLQNQRQAREIIAAKNLELITKNLGDFGQELYGIAQQAQDSAKQLAEIGEATAENIGAIRSWQATMIAAATESRLASQEQEYAQLFAANATDVLASKFKKLGFSLPANTAQFKQLIDAIDITTVAGIDLRGQLLALGSEFTSLISSISDALRTAYDARITELDTAREQFKGFSITLQEFKKSLAIGALSPLTPQQKYDTTRQEFVRVSALAQSGDIKAIEQLPDVSSSFLEASRTMFASSEAYTQDFGLVNSVLDNTTTIAERQVQLAEQTISEIRSVVGGLIDLENTAVNSDVILTGVGAELEKAIADYITALNATTVDTSAQEVALANERNAILNASSFLQVQISEGIDNTVNAIAQSIVENAANTAALGIEIGAVATGVNNVDYSIGDVQDGIVNLDNNLGTLLGSDGTLAQKLQDIATNQDEETGWGTIVTAIETQLGRDSATVSALRTLDESFNNARSDAERTANQPTVNHRAVVEGALNTIRANTTPAAPEPTKLAIEEKPIDPVAPIIAPTYYYGTNIYMDSGAADGFGIGAAGDAGIIGGFGDGFGNGNIAAKGKAFIGGGLELFAKGGIVESPTLFKFAKGTGLMGEAGPEAIMPLRRDAQGNLGVIAQQTNDELLAEIAKLNAQVQQLTQVVAQGAVINAQATDRNTEAITTTIQTTATDKQYMKKVQSRTSVV